MNANKFTLATLYSAAIIFITSAIPGHACTTAIVSAGASETGRPLLWKQRDTSNPFNEVRHISGKGYAYTGIFNCSDKRSNSAFMGVNVVGFAIMNNQSYNVGDGEGDHNGVIMSLALQQCSTVDEFEAFLLKNLDKYSISSNYGVIDAKGGAAYFEVGGKTCKRYDVPEDGWLVRTNYSFAGDGAKLAGTARYKTAEHTMSTHKGKFGVQDLIDGLGRSFYNEVTGVNAIRKGPVALDRDFIARPTTVSSVCVEGVTPADRPDASIMWSATGYTPCCYAVPVWVAAGNEIPSFLSTKVSGDRSANKIAYKLKNEAHPAEADVMGEYIDFRPLKPVLAQVRKAEKQELRLGYQADASIRKTFDIKEISAFNRDAESRYESFLEKVL